MQLGKNSINFVRERFSPQEIVKQWLDLFVDICNEKPPQPQAMKPHFLYNLKFLRENLRRLKNSAPLLRKLPAVVEVKSLLLRAVGKK